MDSAIGRCYGPMAGIWEEFGSDVGEGIDGGRARLAASNIGPMPHCDSVVTICDLTESAKRDPLPSSGNQAATELERQPMSSTINFKSASAAADAILKADKAKLEWRKLPFVEMPQDLQALAIVACNAAIAAREARDALQSALDDKVEAPPGKRLVVTLGRDVGPSTDSVLVAWASAGAGTTKTISFADFTGTRR